MLVIAGLTRNLLLIIKTVFQEIAGQARNDETLETAKIKQIEKHTKLMAQHDCENCSIRAKYDKAPKSLIGRFWRWHINFCPGWKKYINSLDDEKKKMLKEKYNLTQITI